MNLAHYLASVANGYKSIKIHDLEFPDEQYTSTVMVLTMLDDNCAAKAEKEFNRYISIIFGKQYAKGV